MRRNLGWFLGVLLLAGWVRGAEPGRIVMLIGEDEYHTWDTLPAFGHSDLEPKGYRVTVVLADATNKNHFPGIVEALKDADLLVLSTRRRNPPRDELDAVRAFLDSGKSLVGIRTACHGFAPPQGTKVAPHTDAVDSWPEFDPQVLGGHYDNHYAAGPITRIDAAQSQDSAFLLDGVDLKHFVGNGSLYRVGPIDPSCREILRGTIPDHPAEPVAWTHIYGDHHARVFFTSLGHPDDFKEAAFRRLLLNAIQWALVKAPEHALKPSEGTPSLNIVDNLRLDTILTEPTIRKPLYINFDERGRMWLVQYRQYPWPAGLKLLSHDNVYRDVYDPPFPPPPPYEGENAKFAGRDMVTIHESTRGDGVFDKTSVFLNQMNLTTAALRGRGGVFVMNTPYLLFYPCENGSDTPTGKPQVLLSGFGLEDTHSIANSLRWGPDGWIYGAVGSTVGSAVIVYGADGKPIPGYKPFHIMGQHIWRYHPETRRFEIFAEGGGNTFGVVFDSKGRLFSGHNGGDTRGFYYSQGSYQLKGFEKHGALSNPFAFGYINPMPHEKVDRFTHTFAIYEGAAFPSEYDGKIFAVAPHRHYIVESDLNPMGSAFGTHDVQKIVTPGPQPDDDFFTPVDIQIGPDGALYVADWRVRQANHYRSSEGQTNPELGRVYRISAENYRPAGVFDLGKLSSRELIDKYLGNSNRWYREQVLRLLGDRKDATLIPILKELVRKNDGQYALDALWALNLSGGFDDAFAVEALSHKESHVRRWAVRLIGDQNRAAPTVGAKLAELARTETDSEVRSQLASSAKRLPTETALPILANLLGHNEDADDLHIPKLIWWAFEAHADDRDAMLKLLADSSPWQSKLRVDGTAPVTENLIRRWAMGGSQAELLACAELLRLSPNTEETAHLVRGFERAFEGRPIPPLPNALAEQLAKVGGQFSVLLGVRRNDPGAIDSALAGINSDRTKPADRIRLLTALGDVRAKPGDAAPAMLKIAEGAGDPTVRNAALSALQRYDDSSIAGRVVAMYASLPADVQPAAQTLLASRESSASKLLAAIDTGAIKSHTISADTVEKLRLYPSPAIARVVERQFPATPASAAEFDEKIQRYAKIVRAGGGRPLEGKKLFYGKASCATCHTVFTKGGHIGPDLTSYDRANLDSMLLAIVNPSAEIREGFENYIIQTVDGRTLDGFKVDENNQVFILRGVDGQNNVIALDQIKVRRVSPRSLMPEGLLDGLSEQEVKDLFAFLSSTTPPM